MNVTQTSVRATVATGIETAPRSNQSLMSFFYNKHQQQSVLPSIPSPVDC